MSRSEILTQLLAGKISQAQAEVMLGAQRKLRGVTVDAHHAEAFDVYIGEAGDGSQKGDFRAFMVNARVGKTNIAQNLMGTCARAKWGND